MRWNVTHAVVATAALLLLASIGAVAQGQGDSSPEPPGSDIAQVTSIEEQAADAMSALAKPRTGTDAMPADAAEMFGSKARFGMNPELSRRAIADTAHSIYLVPARDHVCQALTVGQGATMTCARTSDVAAGRSGAATATLEADGIAIFGMVPDGVRSVTVATGESAQATVPIENNSYFWAVPKGTVLRDVSFVGPSGAVAFPLYDPALAFERS